VTGPPPRRAVVFQCHSDEQCLQEMSLPLPNEYLKDDSLISSRLDSDQYFEVWLDCSSEMLGLLGTSPALNTSIHLPSLLFPHAVVNVLVLSCTTWT